MTREQRLVLIIAIMASFVSFLDSSVVTVALPAIDDELGGGIATQQWVVDAYLITLSSLILIAGSLSDLLGRLVVLRVGLIGFGVTSIACAIAPTAELLIVARGAQGIAGALLVPSSLAIILSNFTGVASRRRSASGPGGRARRRCSGRCSAACSSTCCRGGSCSGSTCCRSRSLCT